MVSPGLRCFVRMLLAGAWWQGAYRRGIAVPLFNSRVILASCRRTPTSGMPRAASGGVARAAGNQEHLGLAGRGISADFPAVVGRGARGPVRAGEVAQEAGTDGVLAAVGAPDADD